MKTFGKRVRWSSLVAVWLGVATLTLTACGGSTAPNSATATGGEADRNATLRVGYFLPKTLNPLTAAAVAAGQIPALSPVYDRLLQIGVDATYEPMLATEWTFSDNGRTLTLALRDGVTFTDGAPFDAAAVKANLDYGLAAEGTALQAELAMVKKVEVVDPATVRIHLTKPTVTILSVLASPLGGIMISPQALDGPDLDSKPVGTGAYVIEQFVPGQRVSYVRRSDADGIWDEKTGKPAKIVINSLLEPQARTNALLSKQVDLAIWGGESTPLQSSLDSGSLIKYPMTGNLNVVTMNINNGIKPFDDNRVRQAVNYAIDRAAITESFQPDAAPRVQPWPEPLEGFDPAREDQYAFNPAKSRELLAEAGYPDGFDAGEMLAPVATGMEPTAEAVQANLAEVGIKVQLQVTDPLSAATEWAKGKHALNLGWLTSNSIEPPMWLERAFLNPFWRPGPPDPTIAKLTAGLDDPTIDPAVSADAVVKALDRATAQALYAPIWQGGATLVATPQVGGLDDLASTSGAVADIRNTYLTK